MSHLFLSRNIEDGNAWTGLPDTTREAVEAAAKQANAYDFIMSMPDGAISHRGVCSARLSGRSTRDFLVPSMSQALTR
jgi:ABC-type multidrug transport system fused ATPase/permease subunit